MESLHSAVCSLLRADSRLLRTGHEKRPDVGSKPLKQHYVTSLVAFPHPQPRL